MAATGEPEYEDTGVPACVHIPTSILVILVFCVALEQACSLSVSHKLFRIRIGVLLCNGICSILSFVINLDLLRESGTITFLNADFVLIVRAFQIFWFFIACLIGYVFVTNSIESAYKSSSYISTSSSTSNVNIIKRKAPSWMNKLWAFCTMIQEIVLFILFIAAFAERDIIYLLFCFISGSTFAVIGSILVIVALIDIVKYVHNTTQIQHDIDSTMNERNLNKLYKLLITMIILTIFVLVSCSYNLYTMCNHISGLIKRGTMRRQDSLLSTVLDDIPDYISYYLILISVDVVFVVWTFKPSAVNYCLFCCNGYKKYSTAHGHDTWRDSFRIDTNTMCYAFCKCFIDNAERKRRNIIEFEKAKHDMMNANDIEKRTQFEEQQTQQELVENKEIELLKHRSITNLPMDGITPHLHDQGNSVFATDPIIKNECAILPIIQSDNDSLSN